MLNDAYGEPSAIVSVVTITYYAGWVVLVGLFIIVALCWRPVSFCVVDIVTIGLMMTVSLNGTEAPADRFAD